MSTVCGQDLWKAEEDESSLKRFRGSTPLTFKFLAPVGLVNLIRANAQTIEDVAGGSVSITDPSDCYPNTNLQVTTLQATMDGDMVVAMRRTLSYVSDCGECVAENGTELRFTVVMPSKSVSALIGVKGTNVQALQRTTGCHIHVDGVALGFGPGGDRAVHINGGPPSLEKGICRAIECIKEFQDTPWFPKWAARTNAERLAATEAPPLPNTDPDGTNLKCGKLGTDECDMRSMAGVGGMPNMPGMPMSFMGGMGGMGLMGSMGLMGGMGGIGMMPAMSGVSRIPGMDAVPSLGGAPGLDRMSAVDGMGGSGGMIRPLTKMSANTLTPTLRVPDMVGMPALSVGAMSNTNGLTVTPAVSNWDDCGAGAKFDSSSHIGPNTVMQAVKDLPSYISQDPRGFLLRCAIPGVLASRLIGQDGSGLREVQDLTGTRISIPGNPEEVTRMMNIEGPLLSACAAYMLMMKRYLEAEQEMNAMVTCNGCVTGR